MKWILTAVCALAALVILSAVFSVAVFLKTVRRQKKANPPTYENPGFEEYAERMRDGEKWFAESGSEEVSITSYDGLRLVARYLPAEGEARGSVILMHGYHGNAQVDFSCVFRFYHDRKYNILLPDQRACGKSEGKYVTFGVRERYDCRDWARYLADRVGGDTPIVFDGVSLGCSTVLMACGLELPENVRAVIADCGYTSPYDIIKHVAREYMHLPAFPLMWFVSIAARLFAGFGLKECSTIEALKQNKIPVFFAHGGRDRFVPTEMSRMNYNAAVCERELFIVPQARHGTSFLVDEAGYSDRIDKFLKKYAETP